jgi:hypothetical protein
MSEVALVTTYSEFPLRDYYGDNSFELRGHCVLSLRAKRKRGSKAPCVLHVCQTAWYNVYSPLRLSARVNVPYREHTREYSLNDF